MAANKLIRIGPVSLTATTTTNLINPPTVTGGTNPPLTSTATYIILRHIRVSNTTTGALTFAIWLGTTGINTQAASFAFSGQATAGALTASTGVSVAAQSYVDWYGQVRLDTADFLVGGASATGLTLNAEGEIGIAG